MNRRINLFLIKLHRLIFNFMFSGLIFLDLTSKLVNNGRNNKHHAYHLNSWSFMMIVDDTDNDGKDFTGGDNKWDYMLFEQFYHSVHNELT